MMDHRIAKPTRRKRFMKPVPIEAFSTPQLSLFQDFLVNGTNERDTLSNAIDLWDSIPRYSVPRKQQERMRLAGGTLPIRRVDFRYAGVALRVVIRPARLEILDATGQLTGKTMEYYPSAREELIEHALRKIAAEQSAGFFDEQEGRSGVAFSLHQLRQELERQGHAMTYRGIAEGLDVLSLAGIDLEAEDDKLGIGRFARSNYLPRMIGVKREDIEKDAAARWYVEFHGLVTDSIRKISYRQYNYPRLMKCSTQLGRWLLSQLVLKFTQAAAVIPFKIKLSTIERDSDLLHGYKRRRDAVAALDEAWAEMKALSAIGSLEKTIESGGRGKLLDVSYKIFPSREFVGEQKAANRRALDAKIPSVTLLTEHPTIA